MSRVERRTRMFAVTEISIAMTDHLFSHYKSFRDKLH